MNKLSHTDESGRAQMVDVGGKPIQRRRAMAQGTIHLEPETIKLVQENQIRKGDVLTVAQLAGIQAAKRTGQLIPLCHPLGLDHIEVQFQILEKSIRAQSQVSCVGRTGVEMEALTAVSVALLTIYDMCKAVDKNMRIDEIKLTNKVKEDVE